MEPEQIIKQVYRGYNILTPKVMRYGWLGAKAVFELSRGTGIEDQDKLFGVTVAVLESNGPRRSEKSKVLFSRLKAEQYIIQLREEFTKKEDG